MYDAVSCCKGVCKHEVNCTIDHRTIDLVIVLRMHRSILQTDYHFYMGMKMGQTVV